MFKVNQLVMYGATGVCKVVKIGQPDFSTGDKVYYFLEPIYKEGMIYAPVDNEKISIRPIISEEEALELIESVADITTEIFPCKSMQQLSSKYQEIIDTHSCKALLKLTKSIYKKRYEAIQNNKKLGQIDKNFMKKAEDLLYGEVAVALHCKPTEVANAVHLKLEEVIG